MKSRAAVAHITIYYPLQQLPLLTVQHEELFALVVVQQRAEELLAREFRHTHSVRVLHVSHVEHAQAVAVSRRDGAQEKSTRELEVVPTAEEARDSERRRK